MEEINIQIITYFYLIHCPYCIKANKAIGELIKENAAYSNIEIERIEESKQPAIADSYDYLCVSSFHLIYSDLHAIFNL